jgi:LmbE family N-acetylglucosaminyl deacetylase
VLAVVAHPDDETFGLGAVVADMTAARAAVHILCYTRGEASTLNENAADLLQARKEELRQASAELGAATVTLLDYPDGRLAAVPPGELAVHVTGLATRHRPDGLLVFDETGITGHPDHRAATAAAVRAARAAGLPVLAWTLPAAVAARCRPKRARRSQAGQSARLTSASGWTGPGSAGPPCCTPARSRLPRCSGGGCSCKATASTCAGLCRHADDAG